MQVNARRLLRSACVGVLALVLGIGIVAYSAKAANYTANLSTAVNWTATAVAQPSAIWNCAPTGTNDSCGVYPGQLNLSSAGITDSAVVTSSGGTGPLSVSTLIPNPIHLTINGGTVDVVAGGQLTLTGASQLVSLTGNPVLSISGGILTNNGTLAMASTGQPLVLNLNGGTFDGAGSTTISGAQGIFNVTGSQGAMTLNQQTINSSGTVNFTAGNTLTMGNGANITNAAPGTFNANGTGTIAQGAGAALVTNQGNLFKSIGANFTVGVPFINTGTVATSSAGVGVSFTGGSGGTGHNTPATWTFGTSAATANFGGAHTFNGTETFTGSGTVTIIGGGTWTLNTSSSLGTGLNLANNGTINFSGTPARTLAIAGGTYSQTGTFSPRLGVGGTFGGGSDSLTVAGAATLGGTLAPVLGYTPTNGESFTVMTCTPCTGTPAYTPITYPGGFFQLTNTGTQLQLTAVAAPPDLIVTNPFTGPASANAGSTVTFSTTLSNSATAGAATSVSFTFTLTGGGTITGGTAAGFTCTPAGTSMTCTSTGGFATGASTAFTITTTAPNLAGSMTLSGTATPTPADANSANNSGSSAPVTIVPAADVSIAKNAPATVVGGTNVVFTIVVSNLGPSAAANVVVDDVPGSGLTFLSATGACTSFPCTIASIPNGNSATISATYKVASNATSITNTAKIVSTSTFDSTTSNNTATITRSVKSPCATAPPSLLVPADGQVNVPVSGTLQWSNVGARFYDVYLGLSGSGCNTLVGTTNGSTSFAYNGLQANSDYEARIVGRESGCTTLSSACIHFRTGAGPCSLNAPTLLSPANGALISSPLTLQWSAVPGATSYHVVVAVNSKPAVDTVTGDTSLEITVDNGPISWSVVALSGNCASVPATGSFDVCSGPAAPLAGVVGAPSSGHTYEVLVVDPLPTTTKYEYQEASNANFTDAVPTITPSPSIAFAHTIGATPQVFFYRVRAFNSCGSNPGPFSKTLRVVIVPSKISERPVLNVPVGTKGVVVEQVFIPGEDQPVSFTAAADKPWIVKIDPSSGILPPTGKTLDVTIDPSQLPNGTFTATVLVTTTPLLDTKIVTNATNPKPSPVTINLVTPVVPMDPSAPTDESLIIPAVGHLVGINSQWRSDIRVYNASLQKMKYILNFISPTSTDVKQTTIETDPGATTALDDIIHNWYGFGEVGDNASGMLEIRPIVADDSTPNALATIVSSRTYNLSTLGTLGQFIPAVRFTNFIGGGTRLSLQQIAQNNDFRTNFGLVEATGHPASVLLSMFTSGGSKLFDLPVTLGGSEQKQLNGLLAQQGFTDLVDGRMEVKVTDGDGKITAYASVIDNNSLDPLFVPGKPLDGTSSERYIVPGVADLNTGLASWRSDVRIFNSGDKAQTATLTFYPEGKGKTPLTASVTVNPNEVKVLDNILQSLFSTHDVGGAMYVDTPGGSQFVVTARTYNQTASGTLGQFIPATTPNDAIDRSSRALSILQIEDSVRFRTNIGLTEVTGKPATVEISVVQPDTKVTPTIEVPLAANEFLQFPLSAFGLGNVYNVRVSVKVVNGDGRVAAYGSVIDQATTAPTYVAAQ